MLFPAFFAIIVGIGMFAQWGISLARRQVPEMTTEPIRIRFHLAAEFITAAALIAAGAGLLTDPERWLPLYLIATGMLLYTIIVSPGYFAQRGQWAMVAVFGVIFVLALVCIGLIFG